MNQSQSVDHFCHVLEKEAQVIQTNIEILRPQIESMIKFLLTCTGRIIITGVGKSGHIGKKIAASLASLGIPSYFVHASEAMHGDFGMILEQDMVLAISNSGESKEVIQLLEHLAKRNIPIIALSGKRDSSLVQASTQALVYQVEEEADHLNLAPTNSTTLTLAIGDALAVALSQAKGFERKDYAVFHPGGKLGEKTKELR